MNFILDTHTFLWFAAGDTSLSRRARVLIENKENRAFLSAASLWEIAIKVSLGKLELAEPFEKRIFSIFRGKPQTLKVFLSNWGVLLTKYAARRDNSASKENL